MIAIFFTFLFFCGVFFLLLGMVLPQIALWFVIDKTLKTRFQAIKIYSLVSGLSLFFLSIFKLPNEQYLFVMNHNRLAQIFCVVCLFLSAIFWLGMILPKAVLFFLPNESLRTRKQVYARFGLPAFFAFFMCIFYIPKNSSKEIETSKNLPDTEKKVTTLSSEEDKDDKIKIVAQTQHTVIEKLINEIDSDNCTTLLHILASNGLSNIQIDEFNEKINSKKVNWELWFVGATEQWLTGSYYASFTCFSGPDGYVPIAVSFPKESKETLLNFMKGERYKVSAHIKHITSSVEKLAGGGILLLENVESVTKF